MRGARPRSVRTVNQTAACSCRPITGHLSVSVVVPLKPSPNSVITPGRHDRPRQIPRNFQEDHAADARPSRVRASPSSHSASMTATDHGTEPLTVRCRTVGVLGRHSPGTAGSAGELTRQRASCACESVSTTLPLPGGPFAYVHPPANMNVRGVSDLTPLNTSRFTTTLSPSKPNQACRLIISRRLDIASAEVPLSVPMAGPRILGDDSGPQCVMQGDWMSPYSVPL